MRTIIFIFVFLFSSFSFAQTDLEIQQKLNEWGESAKEVSCHLSLSTCKSVMSEVSTYIETKQKHQALLTLLAVVLGAGMGAAVDGDNHWQGALIGGVGSFAGAQLLSW